MKYSDGIQNFKGRVITNAEGRALFYSPRWDEYLLDYQFCSEEFLCNTCLREGRLVKGVTRFDSLVQCEAHAPQARKINAKLSEILSRNATVITDLGL